MCGYSTIVKAPKNVEGIQTFREHGYNVYGTFISYHSWHPH